MAVLKKNITLHPFTVPSADTDTAAPESNGASAQKGGETLKLPRPIFHAFSRILHVYGLIVIGDFDPCYIESLYDSLSCFQSDDEKTPADEAIESGYRQLLKLTRIYCIVPKEDENTILTAIQGKAYEVAELLSNKYPILKPIFERYVKD